MDDTVAVWGLGRVQFHLPAVGTAMSETLGETLHRLWIEMLVRQAQLIHDHPPGEERTREARKLLYGVLYDSALGRLSHAEREQILSRVDFVRDHHAPDASGAVGENPAPDWPG